MPMNSAMTDAPMKCSPADASHNSKYPVLHFNDDDNVRCIGRVIGIVPIDARPTEMEQAELDDLQHEAAQRH